MLLSWDGFQMKVDNGIVRLIKYSHGMKDIDSRRFSTTMNENSFNEKALM